jgi:hypothetical protein
VILKLSCSFCFSMCLISLLYSIWLLRNGKKKKKKEEECFGVFVCSLWMPLGLELIDFLFLLTEEAQFPEFDPEKAA